MPSYTLSLSSVWQRVIARRYAGVNVGIAEKCAIR
jgi:hypothetical protein